MPVTVMAILCVIMVTNGRDVPGVPAWVVTADDGGGGGGGSGGGG